MTSSKHKAATEIALIAHQDPSLFSLWVNRYWKLALGASVAVSAAILVSQHLKQRGAAEREARWSLAREAIAVNPFSWDVTVSDEAAVVRAVEEVKGTEIEPWTLVGLVHATLAEKDYAGAREGLGRLQATHEPSLTEDRVSLAEVGESKTLVEWLQSRLDAQEKWEAARPQLIANPPPPADAPRVRIVTSEGDIVVALYQAEAPEHVANFLKLSGEGYYDGTKFHRVGRNFMIQGGDPNSKEADFEKWGQGGPGYTIPAEKNELLHFRGVLSAAKTGGAVESSGSQFFITTGTPHHLDGKHVVFGAVLEGMSVADTIADGPIEDARSGRPETPIEVLRVEVL